MENPTGRLSHAIIVAGPDPEARRQRVRELAAAMLCRGEGPRPCRRCDDCRRVFAGIHPDCITLERRTDAKGQLRREIQVDQIRDLGADTAVLPNQADVKVYILEDADTMNAAAQNALLKLLEEPPAWVRLILSVTSGEALLPTVRSRCVTYTVRGEPAAPGEYREEALEFLTLAARGDRPGLTALCRELEKLDNAGCTAFVEQLRTQVTEQLCLRSRTPPLPREALPGLLAELDLAAERLRLHVGVKHVLGVLALLDISKKK
jgi:DNA polymerase III delta prime subunit